MRKIYFLLFTVFSCLATTQNSFSQTVTIGTGTSVQRFPLNYYYGYGRSSMIYTATEMGTTGTGASILSIAFECNTALNTGPTVIFFQEAGTATTQTATTWATKISAATTVYNGTPAVGVAGWRTITLTTPFPLSANQNLEVMIECNFGNNGTGPSTGNDVRYSTETNAHQYWEQDLSAPAGSGTVTSNRPNIQMVLGPPIVCVAPPSGGTTQGPSGSVCPGGSFALSVTGASFGTGLTYQWESSPDNITWNPIAGATSVSLNISAITNTYYRRKITCSSIDAYSTSVLVTVASVVSVFPWTENFDALGTIGSTSFPTCWTKQNGDWRSANNASTGFDANALSAPNFIQNSWSATNEFIWTPGFQLTAGTSYDFSFWFADFDAQTSWVAEVFYNTAPNSSGATQLGTPFVSTGTAAPIVYTSVRRTFVPSVSGVYFFAIRVNEATGDPWYLSFDDFRFEVTPSCFSPTGLSASGLTITTATLNWIASVPPPGDGYEWEVRTSGAAGSGATGLVASGSVGAGILTANVTGLTSNTQYSFYVRSACIGGSLYSAWSNAGTFRTLCDPTNVPYIQDFDAAVSPDYPSCLTLQDLNGATTWKMWYEGDIVASSQPNSIYYEWNASTPGDDWFFLRGLNLTGGETYTLSFKYKGSHGPALIEKLEVKYGTASNASAMTSGTLFTNTNIISSINSPFAASSVTFTPVATGVYFIGFHAFSAADQAFLFVDDISVETCPKPTNVTVLGISTTSAVVSVTSPGSSFVVEYGSPGFVPGTTESAGAGTVVLSASSPVIISGLAVNTAYDFYIRNICIPGVDISSNVKATATTLCAATNIPYTQDFDAVTPPAIPVCTSIQDLNGSPTWATIAPAAAWGFEGNALRYLYDPAKPANDWFYTQGLNLTAGTLYEVSFKYGATDPLYPESMKVAFGTTATNTAMINTIVDLPDIVANGAAPFANKVRYTFTPAVTGVHYLGFQAYSLADQFQLFLDSIHVKIAPPVDVGITGIITPALSCPTNGVIIQAAMRNFNLSTIDFSVDPITVTANITGTATATLTATINSGTLAAGASMDTYLSPAFDFAAGTYNITVATSSPDDPETANDSYTTLIKVNPIPVVPVITPAASQVCIGNTVQLSTQFTSPPPPSVNHPAVSSGAISLAIPDNSPAGISHTLPVSGIPVNATITGFSVTINATHTWNSDLIFNLKAPGGNILNLVNRKGGSGHGFTDAIISSASNTPLPTANTTPVTGTFAADAANAVGPTGYISNVIAFSGLYSIGNGNWTLAIRDAFAGDIGILTSWSITITYQVLNPVVTWSPVAGLFTDALATTAYTGGDAYSVYAKPATTTTYTVTATGLGGCTSKGTATVTVNPYPVITIGSIPDTVCISDQLISLEATPVGGVWSGTGVSGTNFVPPSTAVGTYTLTYRYTDNFGCTSTATKKISVKDCPERIILLSDNAVMLYPNPNDGRFNIRINSVLYNYLGMKVFTNDGVLVRTQQFGGLAYGRVIPIDISNLPGGVYMVKFYYDGGVRSSEKTFKVIIGR